MEWKMIEFRKVKETSKLYLDELKIAGLNFDTESDCSWGIYEFNRFIGSYSLFKNIIKRIFVKQEFRGQGFMAQLVTHAIKELVKTGEASYFVFTKLCNEEIMNSLGFQSLARTSNALLLEGGTGGIEDYIKGIQKMMKSNVSVKIGSVVVNCNPMTFGHLHLIKQAYEKVDCLIVFVVEEDRSTFSFESRVGIIKEATAEFKNLYVVGTGKYIVSAATFPAYFTAQKEVADTQAELDAVLFVERIAAPLGINLRMVGEEPYCPVTCKYNEAMKRVFSSHDLDFQIIERKLEGEEAISASLVRKYLASGELEKAFLLVPDATRHFLESPKGLNVIDKLQQNTVDGKRH